MRLFISNLTKVLESETNEEVQVLLIPKTRDDIDLKVKKEIRNIFILDIKNKIAKYNEEVELKSFMSDAIIRYGGVYEFLTQVIDLMISELNSDIAVQIGDKIIGNIDENVLKGGVSG